MIRRLVDRLLFRAYRLRWRLRDVHRRYLERTRPRETPAGPSRYLLRLPTPGRPAPASSIVPLSSMIDPRRSAPSGIVCRAPEAFHVPSNSRHSPDAAGSGSGRRSQAINTKQAPAPRTSPRTPKAKGNLRHMNASLL